jgi:glycosyltransferase involved in cell wall biosynthesis
VTRRRIVLVTTRVALPATRGQQVRTDEWLRALADDRIALVCPRPSDDRVAEAVAASGVAPFWYPHPPAAAARGLVAGITRGLPAQESLYRTRPARAALARALADPPADLLIVQTVRCAWAVERLRAAPAAPRILFDAIDSMALHYRHRARSTTGSRRWLVLAEARRCERRERWLAGRAALSVAVADRDLAAFAPPERGRVVAVSGRPARAVGRAVPEEPVVLLSGNLGYRPTVDAAVWFGREVWPRVRAARPDARWVLAGARPAPAVRRLAEEPGVELHAEPPDLGPFLARAAVAVAPMATGSGIPLKVLEAWAEGVPVVAAPWAVEGLGESAGEALVVAGEPGRFADGVIRILSDPEHARRIADAGLARWRRRYHPDRIAEAIRDAVAHAIDRA